MGGPALSVLSPFAGELFDAVLVMAGASVGVAAVEGFSKILVV